MQDLNLTSTEDLIKELGSRYEHFIFGGIMTSYGQSTNQIHIRRWNGNHYMCMGLCSDINIMINDDLKEKEGPINEP